MRGYLVQLFACSGVMFVFILLMLALKPLLYKRSSARCRYNCWLPVLLGLLLPYRPPLSLTALHTAAPALPAAPSPIADAAGAINSTVAGFTQRVYHAPELVFYAALLVWMAGCVGVILHQLLHYCRFTVSVKRLSTPSTSARIEGLLRYEQERLHLTSPVMVRLCGGTIRPMLLGLVHPVILLPREAEEWGSERLALILRHELVHYKHRDVWVKVLVLAATALHWFNPLVWRMALEVSHQCECACDEETIKGSTLTTRRLYGEALISAASNRQGGGPLFSTSFTGGENHMKERILALLDTKPKRIGALIVAVAIVGTLATGAVLAAVSWNNVPQQEKPWLAPAVEQKLENTIEDELERLRLKPEPLPEGVDPTTIDSYETEVISHEKIPVGGNIEDHISSMIGIGGENKVYGGKFWGQLTYSWKLKIDDGKDDGVEEWYIAYRGTVTRQTE